MRIIKRKFILNENIQRNFVVYKSNVFFIILFIKWQSWTKLFGISDELSSLKYFISLLMYVLLSVVFSLTAASLVKMFAPYACGSGVPEVYIQTKS
jgi:H+/Cl- antiporter ClcA